MVQNNVTFLIILTCLIGNIYIDVFFLMQYILLYLMYIQHISYISCKFFHSASS